MFTVKEFELGGMSIFRSILELPSKTLKTQEGETPPSSISALHHLSKDPKDGLLMTSAPRLTLPYNVGVAED